jgi:hypothetical protein
MSNTYRTLHVRAKRQKLGVLQTLKSRGIYKKEVVIFLHIHKSKVRKVGDLVCDLAL